MLFPSLQDCVDHLRSRFEIVTELHCNYTSVESAKSDLYIRLAKIHQNAYRENQRLIFIFDSDLYDSSNTAGGILQTLQVVIQDIDISNFFVCLVTTNPMIEDEYQRIKDYVSWDSVPFNIYKCQGSFARLSSNFTPMDGKQQSLKHISAVLSDMEQRHRNLLFGNESFCMMPWVGINIEPNSTVRPCCEFDLQSPLGNVKHQTIREIWNSSGFRAIRQSMLAGKKIKECHQCYHKEKLKRESLRNSVNRDFAKHVHLLDMTNPDGSLDDTVIRYWDVRYNNLCNFSCRSCNPSQSSSWYQVHNELYPDRKLTKPLLLSGDSDDSIFDQMCENISSVEKIYFAGGEPLIIENFYKILELLDSENRHDVHLIYNTNLSRLRLRDRSILDLWKKFPKVSVGASLDAMGERGEYLRTGTVWTEIENNRLTMIQECPHIDFYVSATTGLVNALHMVDFHRDWVDRGFIRAEDFNIQLLYHPDHMSVINAPSALKKRIVACYELHLDWLRSRDPKGRATAGFRSVIGMCQQAGKYDHEKFWKEIDLLDRYHGTLLLSTFPELVDTGL